MSSLLEYNEEQYQMLRLAIEDTRTGICLFRTYSAIEQVNIANRLKNESIKRCCAFDMAKIKKDDLPFDIERVRKLLVGYEECEVVIWYNLQICGARLGDEEYIQNLNYMRDQLLAMNKVWVLGSSPYFATLLSRSARDLYSCIMNHFEFKDEAEDAILMFQESRYTGDVRLDLLKFKELQTGIKENGIDNVSETDLLEAVAAWNKIYEFCNQKTVTWIVEVLEKIEQKLSMRELTARECIAYRRVSRAYYLLQKHDKAILFLQMIFYNTRRFFSEQSPEMTDLHMQAGEIYLALKEYDKAKEALSKVVDYYVKNNNENSFGYVAALDIFAQIHVFQGNIENAITIYSRLIDKIEALYGKESRAFANALNNLGAVYAYADRMSEALRLFLNAEQLYKKSEEENLGAYANTLKNIGLTYRMIGDFDKAIEYMKKAKNVIDKVAPSLQNTRCMEVINGVLEECNVEV